MLKLVDKDSDEHRIYETLLNSGPYSDPKTFPCVLPAMSVMDTPHKYAIVSMPMYNLLLWPACSSSLTGRRFDC